MWGIVVTSVWWVTGYYLVIYLAGLQDIPRHLYEAASIDGAGVWRSFWSITVPLLRPVFLFVFVIHIIGSFQIFGQVFIMTQGGPGDATRTVVQHLYETAFSKPVRVWVCVGHGLGSFRRDSGLLGTPV